MTPRPCPARLRPECQRAAAVVCALFLFSVVDRSFAATYPHEVVLSGATETSDKVSGYRGTAFTLSVDDDSQGMLGISSAERSDNPCWLWIGTESVNDPARNTGTTKDLCGNKATSSTMKAEYRDDMYFGQRVFVSGVRICTNNKETRVKGFQLRGKQILDDASLTALAYPESLHVVYSLGGGTWDVNHRADYADDAKAPADFRNNCHVWHEWAECPGADQIAVGVVAHFEAGKEPRSLTGVALRCRSVAPR